jgi:hypothetical protein
MALWIFCFLSNLAACREQAHRERERQRQRQRHRDRDRDTEAERKAAWGLS